jgi:hypothetical protein
MNECRRWSTKAIIIATTVTTVRTIGFLCIAVIFGAASLAPAAGQNGHEAELRQCVANNRGSSWESGGDESEGYTGYDNLVWHCQAEVSHRRGSRPQPQRPRAQGAKRRH